MTRRFNGKFAFFSTVLLAACQVPADELPRRPRHDSTPIIANNYIGPSKAIETLQNRHSLDGSVFVEQSELDSVIDHDGGGACASAAGIDLLQILRLMCGLDYLPNPHKVALKSFADQADLLKGRVSNEQFVRLIKFYEQFLSGYELRVAVQCASGSPFTTTEKTWSKKDGPEFASGSSSVNVLSFTVTEEHEGVIGRHFVILKSREGDQITVLDPQKPTKDHQYRLEATGKGTKRIFLRSPPGVPTRGRTFELNTVFAVSFGARKAQSSSTAVSRRNVDDIKIKINEAASDLRGTDFYLSPIAWRKRTARFGLPGLDLPAEHGGSGWKAVDLVEIFRHAGRYNLNFRDVVGGAHCRPLLASKSPEVLEIVRKTASGEAYVAIAITEPSAGSDIRAIESTSRKTDGGYLLTGTKRFNARLNQATHLVLFTQGTTGVHGELNVFVVPIDKPGLQIEALTAHGLTGNSYGGVTFKDLFVPESHRIGDEGKGMRVFFQHFLYWRLMQTAAAIGTGESALEQMADRIKTRQAFGGPIGRFTHLQQPIGQHTTELRMAHSLVKEAAERIDRGDYGDETRAIICGLKAEGVEVALKAVDAAVRAFGGEGYSTNVDLGDRLRDLNGLRIADGTTDVMRMEVVRHFYGSELWEMAVKSYAK